MRMDTNLTVNQIECAIAKYFDIRKNLIVCNVSWGMLPYEADMLILSKSGYLTEVEIKRSLSDFKADFLKKHTHDDERIKDFYFAVPLAIKNQAADIIQSTKGICVSGLLTYREDCFIEYHKLIKNNIVFRNSRKLFLEEQLMLARLGCMRVWTLKNKMI